MMSWREKMLDVSAISEEDRYESQFLSKLLCTIDIQSKLRNLSHEQMAVMGGMTEKEYIDLITWESTPKLGTLLKFIYCLDMSIEIED